MNSASRTIAQRVAKHLRAGEVVNLGIGIPTVVAEFLAADSGVVLQTENGMLGVGPAPAAGAERADLVNAGKQPVTELPGASYFSSSQSFAMIRGGHVDVAVLGALQVDEAGRIANWSLPGRPILGVGGAMDLLSGARHVIVAAAHLTKDGQPRLVRKCSFPLTGERPADLMVTERATFSFASGVPTLIELAAGTSSEWVREHTDARYREAVAHQGT